MFLLKTPIFFSNAELLKTATRSLVRAIYPSVCPSIRLSVWNFVINFTLCSQLSQYPTKQKSHDNSFFFFSNRFYRRKGNVFVCESKITHVKQQEKENTKWEFKDLWDLERGIKSQNMSFLSKWHQILPPWVRKVK